MTPTRTDVARTLRRSGLTASRPVGRGFTTGYTSWQFGPRLFVRHTIGTGNQTPDDERTIAKNNAVILAVLTAAGMNAVIPADHPDRIEIL